MPSWKRYKSFFNLNRLIHPFASDPSSTRRPSPSKNLATLASAVACSKVLSRSRMRYNFRFAINCCASANSSRWTVYYVIHLTTRASIPLLTTKNESALCDGLYDIGLHPYVHILLDYDGQATKIPNAYSPIFAPQEVHIPAHSCS